MPELCSVTMISIGGRPDGVGFEGGDMTRSITRREFVRELGLKAAVLPFLLNLPSLGFAGSDRRKTRLVVMFSPNGVVPSAFWPDEEGEKFTLKPILEPLAPFRD